MNLVFLGPPGSGKGTQAIRIAEKFNLVHLSTGEVLREATAAQSELGKQAEKFMKEGALVPDEVIIELVGKMIADGVLSKGFILDGFPRTIPQAKSLSDMLERNSSPIDKAILINVADEVIIERIKGRAEEENRADDDEKVVRNRLTVYKALTEPIVGYYRDESILSEIEGDATPDEVFESIVKVVS